MGLGTLGRKRVQVGSFEAPAGKGGIMGLIGIILLIVGLYILYMGFSRKK